MNIKEYISSGVVESYVLGLLTDTERQEFESLCAQYPEIVEARNSFEMDLEARLLADAVPAPQHLKAQIEEKLTSNTSELSAAELEEERTPVRQMGAWKWLAAASLLLTAAAAYWGYDNNRKYKSALADNKQLQEQLSTSTASLDTMKRDAEMLQKPGVKMAALKTEDNRAFATIYWDTTSGSGDVYLMINNLPQPASDKQYQLWALLDGKPIDLGMIEARQRLLTRMKNVQNAQAFAITLEPKGGSPAPTSQPISVSQL